MKLGLLRNWESLVIRPRENVCSLRRGGGTQLMPRWGGRGPVGLVFGPGTSSSTYKLCADLEARVLLSIFTLPFPPSCVKIDTKLKHRKLSFCWSKTVEY